MNLPKDWKYIKLSELFDEVSEKNHSDAEVLTIVQGVGTVLRKDSGRDIIYDKNSLSNYKYVQKDDFIIHLRSFEGGLEIANQEGIVSPAYIILHPKIQTEPGYLYTFFHSNRFINQTIAPAVEGVRDGRSVKYEVLKNQNIPFPPLAEQQKIAEILCKQDKIISLKQKLLEQKQQQKKWLMQKLLDVPLKNADCEEKFSLDGVMIDKSGWKKEVLENVTAYSCVRKKDLESSYICTENMKPDFGGISFYKTSELIDGVCYEKGDIVLGNIRPYLRKAWMADRDGVCSADVLVLKLTDKVFSDFLYNVIANEKFLKYVMKGAKGTKMPRGDKEHIMKYVFYLPNLPEQKIIAQVLSTADKEIALLKSSIEQEKQKKKSLAQLLLTGTVRVKI